MGCHFLLQGIFLTQGSNPCPLCLLYWQMGSLPPAPPGKPCFSQFTFLAWCLSCLLDCDFRRARTVSDLGCVGLVLSAPCTVPGRKEVLVWRTKKVKEGGWEGGSQFQRNAQNSPCHPHSTIIYLFLSMVKEEKIQWVIWAPM